LTAQQPGDVDPDLSSAVEAAGVVDQQTASEPA
jgi:hypothetical protein